LVIAIFVAAALLFESGSEPQQDQVDREFVDITDDLVFRYAARDNDAVDMLDPRCREAPDRSNPSCVQFILTLAEIDPILADVLDRLDRYLEDPPSKRSHGALLELEDARNRFGLAHQANSLLLSGWESGETVEWAAGWSLRRSYDELAARQKLNRD
jgi:hypothetical protein